MDTRTEGAAALWVDRAADVEIVDGVTCWSVWSGGRLFEMHGPISVLVESIARSKRALADWQQRGSATILEMPRRKRKKH